MMDEINKGENFFTPENYVKLYEDKAWMNQKWNVEGYNAKQIANELHISVKLVHIWLKKHEIY